MIATAWFTVSMGMSFASFNVDRIIGIDEGWAPYQQSQVGIVSLFIKDALQRMKGINTPGQALDSGGVASFSAPRDGVSHLAFPALARERNHHADSFPLAPLGNKHYL
jgi:hypothetical protein